MESAKKKPRKKFKTAQRATSSPSPEEPNVISQEPAEADETNANELFDRMESGQLSGVGNEDATDEDVTQISASKSSVRSDAARPSSARKTSPESGDFEQKHPPPKMPNPKQYDVELRQFSHLDPGDYGIEWEDADVDYMPPERATMPDIQRLLASLDDPDSKLLPDSELPKVKEPEATTKIVTLREEIEAGELRPYAQDFEHQVKDDVLMIGNIELEDIQDEERRLREEHIQYQQQEAERARQRERALLVQEEESKQRAAGALKQRRLELQRQEAMFQQRERELMTRLHKAFRRSEGQLVSALSRRKAEVKTMYGDLTLSEGQYGGARGRRWKVDWDRTPQPIQVQLKCLRGVKDKLPGGRYVLMVSLYNRLGGHVMRWSKLRGQQWGGTTLPVFHEGQFYNSEIKVDQSVFTVLPARPNVRPGMIILFEVFLLRGNVVPSDRVVAWGCFPICDGEFNVIEGKYKVPLLRGEMDMLVDKHERFEQLMSTELDHWLANLYFSVNKLPRYLAGQKEYEVELTFSSSLLSFPDRTRGAEPREDGDAPRRAASTLSLRSHSASDAVTSSGTNSSDLGTFKKVPQDSDSVSSLPSKHPLPESETPQVSVLFSRKLNGEDKTTLRLDGVDDTGSDYDEQDVYGLKMEESYQPVPRAPGLFYKRHMNNPVDVYMRRQATLLPRTQLLGARPKQQKLTPLEELELHQFNVRKPFTGKGRLEQRGWERFHYVRRQFLAEIGLSEWRSVEFWGMMLILALTFWLRMYLHYTVQWLVLAIINIPVNRFDFFPYTVYLNYQQSLLQARQEIGVVVAGPLGCVLVMCLLTFFSWCSQRIFGFFPDLLSKFVLAFGIQSFFDPYLIALIDLCMPDRRWYNNGGNLPIADFVKLWYKFESLEGLGLAGAFITVFIYLATTFAAGAVLYMYFLRLHNNGRLLDIYWRLHGDADQFFVPHDLELTNQELSYICRKAEQWRGEEGERRKVAVYDYIWEEENVEETVWDENAPAHGRDVPATAGREVTTHVSIYTLHVDGLRELYRHFLRLPDGTIVEVFGDMSSLGMDKDLRRLMQRGTKDVEGLGSVDSLRDYDARSIHSQTSADGEGKTKDE